jgi:lauroyl/myristoyl acyltransferase
MNALIARLWIALIEATRNWPQSARTRLGALLGDLLWWVVVPRRRVTLTNLRACESRGAVSATWRAARSTTPCCGAPTRSA